MNNGPMKSPFDAAQEIRQLLSSYIQAHQELPTSAWFSQANAGLIAFNEAFPESEGATLLNLDSLKEHVLTNLAPQFVVMVKWLVGFHGASTLRTDLEKAANAWPKHQDYLVYAAEQKAEQALREKAAAEAEKQRLAEEKMRAEQDAESIRQTLIERQQQLEAQLAAIKIESSETVAGLREVNTLLIDRVKSLSGAASAAESAEAKNQLVHAQGAHTQKRRGNGAKK